MQLVEQVRDNVVQLIYEPILNLWYNKCQICVALNDPQLLKSQDAGLTDCLCPSYSV